jgi:hypothetical protein
VGKAMSAETRMAIEQSTPMPPPSENGMSVRYETKVLSLWDWKACAEVACSCTYQISWILEQQCWRSFLCSVRELAR